MKNNNIFYFIKIKPQHKHAKWPPSDLTPWTLTLSKAVSFERRIMVIKFSCEKNKFDKKTFQAEKPFQIWQKYFWSKRHFCWKTNFGQKSIFVQIALSCRNAIVMHFEELLSRDDLLAHWNFVYVFLSASIYDFESTLKTDESIFTRLFFNSTRANCVVKNTKKGNKLTTTKN